MQVIVNHSGCASFMISPPSFVHLLSKIMRNESSSGWSCSEAVREGDLHSYQRELQFFYGESE